MAVHVYNEGGKFTQVIEIDNHRLFADQPIKDGGDDKGVSPHDFLLAALGSCTTMTVKMYSDRKGWPLKKVDVEVSLVKEDKTNVFQRTIKFEGDLDKEQRARLLEIANRCPVHVILTGQIKITTELVN